MLLFVTVSFIRRVITLFYCSLLSVFLLLKTYFLCCFFVFTPPTKNVQQVLFESQKFTKEKFCIFKLNKTLSNYLDFPLQITSSIFSAESQKTPSMTQTNICVKCVRIGRQGLSFAAQYFQRRETYLNLLDISILLMIEKKSFSTNTKNITMT